jgi:hypothetical protein
LGAVNVHGLGVGDGDHECWSISRGLAAVVFASVAAVSAVASAAGGSDGLEIGVYGVALGLAGCVGVGGGDAVVLADEVEGDHVARLGGDGVGGELEFVVGGNGDGHYGGGSARGQQHEGWEKHFGDDYGSECCWKVLECSSELNTGGSRCNVMYHLGNDSSNLPSSNQTIYLIHKAKTEALRTFGSLIMRDIAGDETGRDGF